MDYIPLRQENNGSQTRFIFGLNVCRVIIFASCAVYNVCVLFLVKKIKATLTSWHGAQCISNFE